MKAGADPLAPLRLLSAELGDVWRETVAALTPRPDAPPLAEIQRVRQAMDRTARRLAGIAGALFGAIPPRVREPERDGPDGFHHVTRWAVQLLDIAKSLESYAAGWTILDPGDATNPGARLRGMLSDGPGYAEDIGTVVADFRAFLIGEAPGLMELSAERSA